MNKPADCLQNDILAALRKHGYRIKDGVSAQAHDPFAWYVIADKDGYEVRLEERAKSLVKGESK